MFYIRPPLGQLTLHVLERCVSARLEYLTHLYHNTTDSFAGNFEYLLENSIHDKVGHFVLRLLATTSADFQEYWVTRETLLLKKRLHCISFRQLHGLFRSIIRQINSLTNKDTPIIKTLVSISTFFLQPSIFEHISSNNHPQDCKNHHCKVRYEFVPTLIKTRQVDLAAGYAIIYCSQWKQLLVSLFHTFINREVNLIKPYALETINADPRLSILNDRIQFNVLRDTSKSGRITAGNINAESEKFPLCMKHLHILLRKRHRLSHYARFYYSLFLKEGGMKLDDAISYWKEEYSKPHTCATVCAHKWQTSEKKFVYSIRHLYGLEGSRKNYKSPDCRQICSRIAGAKYEGGCPFKNFDRHIVKNLVNSSLTDDHANTFLDTAAKSRPESACTEFFKIISGNHDENTIISSPVQYYLSMVNTS